VGDVYRVALGQVFLLVFGSFLSQTCLQSSTVNTVILSNSGPFTKIKSQSNTSVKSVACQLCV
jgi:hypothetical protein